MLDSYHGPAAVVQGEKLVDVHCTWQQTHETVRQGEYMPAVTQWSGYFTAEQRSPLTADEAVLQLRDGRIGRILIVDFDAAAGFARFQGLGEAPALGG